MERFWSKVGIRGPDDCWLWLAARTSSKNPAYGSFGFRGAVWKAHRVAFVLEYGIIPEGMNVCHKCDVTLCVNPRHLFAGSQKDNMQDCASKGRTPFQIMKIVAPLFPGELNGRAKLTWQQVAIIRTRYASGESQQRIANDFGVSQVAISHIVRGKSWTHVS